MQKELNIHVKTAVPVIGVVEKMAGYMCSCCNEITDVFSGGGGKVMAEERHVPFMGSVPIDTTFGTLREGGEGELCGKLQELWAVPDLRGVCKDRGPGNDTGCEREHARSRKHERLELNDVHYKQDRGL